MLAAITRYFGLSSTGITYKSGSASFGTGGYRSSDRYGGSGDNFRESYKDRDPYGEEKTGNDTFGKSRRGVASENQGNTLKKGFARYGSFWLYCVLTFMFLWDGLRLAYVLRF